MLVHFDHYEIMSNLFTHETSERTWIVIMSSSAERSSIECQKQQDAINCCLMESKHRHSAAFMHNWWGFRTSAWIPDGHDSVGSTASGSHFVKPARPGCTAFWILIRTYVVLHASNWLLFAPLGYHNIKKRNTFFSFYFRCAPSISRNDRSWHDKYCKQSFRRHATRN